ncbi:hypothetical protein [Shouchella clausii]|uniref:hypothetical protein n=1 Tax=Shouchella clausii TaxID=79880 RepID=UPI001C73399C|nr:hypothetical protein [Shouchella clausii]MBX0320293.1 hypothetical protein [Shouchella clausii]
MLTKFPIKSDRGVYRVTIRRSLNIIFNYVYVIKVYQESGSKFPLLRFKKIYHDVVSVIDWRDDLINLAKKSVIEAELYLDREYRKSTPNLQAIEAFRNWDGDMTKEKR